MTNLGLVFAILLATGTTAFGQTSVIVDVRVVNVPLEKMQELRRTPANPVFARALSRSMSEYLMDESRAKPVHHIELPASNGTATQFRLDSRVPAAVTAPLESQSFFDIGLGIEI